MIECEDGVSRTQAQVTPTGQSGIALKRISPAIGVEVSGIDLRQPMTPEQYTELRQALVAHKVLVFRDQNITPAQHVAFARRFGDLELHPVFPHHPDHPELVLLGGNSKIPGTENVYHTDVSWRETPSMASILRCVECPEVGGDTVWINMEEAYEKLPEARKQQISKLFAVHDILPSFGARMTPEEQLAARAKYPPVVHPVVRTHPESGKKILYVNETFVTHFANFTSHFDSFRSANEIHAQQQDLMNYLLRQPALLEYQMRLHWEPNTIAMWDNRSTQHYAISDYFPAVRRMHRATVIGDKPF
ncbi:taurine dioxygenase [Comamonas testosteroni]|uniref:Taurine dioxygenase n=1 Tax=Comamonas testosteroni TaxID=285 RepID=A0A373FR65_COMTE|nr:TauD/TfdA family dioxygenase [Comamonas testosteroni]RGE46367.1 taurine dioxygenase [Comamonas testosteroni]